MSIPISPPAHGLSFIAQRVRVSLIRHLFCALFGFCKYLTVDTSFYYTYSQMLAILFATFLTRWKRRTTCNKILGEFITSPPYVSWKIFEQEKRKWDFYLLDLFDSWKMFWVAGSYNCIQLYIRSWPKYCDRCTLCIRLVSTRQTPTLIYRKLLPRYRVGRRYFF